MYKIIAEGSKNRNLEATRNKEVPRMGCNSFVLPGMLLFALIGILIKNTPSCGPNAFGLWPVVTNFAEPLKFVIESRVASDLKQCAFPMSSQNKAIFRVTACDRANSSWHESSVSFWSRYTVSNIGASEKDRCLVVRKPYNGEHQNCTATYNSENELICSGGTPPSSVWDVDEQQCFHDQFIVNYFDNTGEKVSSPKTGQEWVFPGLFGLYFPLFFKRGYWELSILCELNLKKDGLSETLNVYSRLEFGNTININQAKSEIDSVVQDINNGVQYKTPTYERVFVIN